MVKSLPPIAAKQQQVGATARDALSATSIHFVSSVYLSNTELSLDLHDVVMDAW